MSTSRQTDENPGLRKFAGMVMLIEGGLLLIFAVATWQEAGYLERAPIGDEYRPWAVAMLVGAILAIATGVAAFQRRSWAQWTGLFVILPLSFLHVLTIPIFPVWSIAGLGLLMIALYGLSASGSTW